MTAPKPQIQVSDRARAADNLEATFELDPETLDPSKHYRWVRETPTRVARHKMLGYRMVVVGDGVVTLLEGDNAGDGRIRNGDSILMVCDKDAVKARRQSYEDRAALRTERSGDEVKQAAKKRGVRSFRRDPDEDDDGE